MLSFTFAKKTAKNFMETIKNVKHSNILYIYEKFLPNCMQIKRFLNIFTSSIDVITIQEITTSKKNEIIMKIITYYLKYHFTKNNINCNGQKIFKKWERNEKSKKKPLTSNIVNYYSNNNQKLCYIKKLQIKIGIRFPQLADYFAKLNFFITDAHPKQQNKSLSAVGGPEYECMLACNFWLWN